MPTSKYDDTHSLPYTMTTTEVRKKFDLDRTILKKLSQKKMSLLSYHIAYHFVVIFLAAYLCEYYNNPLLYLIALMLIGAHQIGLGTIALHDGGHGLLLNNRRLNDLFARFIYTMVLGAPFLTFNTNRKGHFVHHNTLNTPSDPDVIFFKKIYHYPNWFLVLTLLYFLSGLSFFLFIGRYIVTHLKKSFISVLFHVSIIAFAFCGSYLGYYPALLLLKYWLIPLVTWGVTINFIRIIAEHYPDNIFKNITTQPRVFLTRDTLPTLWDKYFTSTCNVGYHLTHHIYPEVPFYHLKKLHQELEKNIYYQKYATTSKGYLSFIWDYLNKRDETKFYISLGSIIEILSMPGSLYEKIEPPKQINSSL
jgi:fatty acid desaturase